MPHFFGSDADILLGVFDGYGEEGAGCAQFVRREFDRSIAKAAAQQRHGMEISDPSGVCKAAMLSLNQQLKSTDECDASCRTLAQHEHAQFLAKFGLTAAAFPLLVVDVHNWNAPFGLAPSSSL